ncbi:hypothetical protein TRVA0_024S01816 [Trichomonascus vanleenenianus]|uniref:uncharacterized protein n=1 Tax=Trichomonascus vanleenenianus TaxID=2268995 RepID=UPI003ECB2755
MVNLLQRGSILVTASPRRYILWPASIAFILSYVTLYAIFTQSLPNAYIPSQIKTEPNDGDGPLIIRQALICPPAFTDALDSSVLDALSPLVQLDQNLDNLPYLHSVVPKIDSLNFTDDNQASSMLYIPKMRRHRRRAEAGNRANGAAGLLVSYIYDSHSESAETKWYNSIARLIGHDVTTTQEASTYVMPKNTAAKGSDLPPFNFYPSCPFPKTFVAAAFGLSFFYLGLVAVDIETVLSQAGLAVTFLVQICLSNFAALTLASMIYPSFSHFNLRQFVCLPFLVSIIGTNHMFRLVNAVSKTLPENSPSNRIASAIGMAAPTSVKRVALDVACLLFGLLPQLGLSDNARALCVYLILGLVIDLLLHLTFFTAVLCVDLRRLELQDLISAYNSGSYYGLLPSSSGSDRKWSLIAFFRSVINAMSSNPDIPRPGQPSSAPSSAPQSRYGSPSSAMQRLKLHTKALIYFQRNYLKRRVPVVMTGVLFGAVVLYLWLVSRHILPGYNAVDTPTGRFVFFLNPLISHASGSSGSGGGLPSAVFERPAIVYEPIVIYSHCAPSSVPLQFSLGESLHGSLTPSMADIMSLNLFLEFSASLVFIVSLTGIVLNYILPSDAESSEPSGQNDTLQFYSKDLIGYHTLDILQMVIQGSWVATVSLDHKVIVWNAATAAPHNPTRLGETPIRVPLPLKFWPATQLTMNSSLGLIALFSASLPAVLVWNFKSRKQIYYIHNPTYFSDAPIETFFSGCCLMVVIKSGKLLSISEHGSIKSFDLPLPSSEAEIITATRLLTPRINEQVVCISNKNDIIVGTHVDDEVWIFNYVDLLESMNAKPLMLGSSSYWPMPAPTSSHPMPEVLGRKTKHEHPVIPSTRPYEYTQPIKIVVPIPQIHMVLFASELNACLLDVHTGTILRHFPLGHYVTKSLRVLHSEPTHCRFCGCVSVESISVAYTDAESCDTVICHTLSIENRARNNICLRVERDPRETRCLGFDAASEKQHWINNVEGWDATEMNMMMGVRRKEEDDAGYSSGSASESFTNLTLTQLASGRKLRNRKKPIQVTPPLNIVWEGWAMSAAGQVSYYDIPDISSRLLIKAIGPVAKYGRKSIAVAFANAIKILYFGNEESFITDVEEGIPYPGRNPQYVTGSGAKKWRRGLL